MIFLFEEYTQESKDLLYSLRKTCKDVIPVCMRYNGDLPDDILSPFKIFNKDEGQPLYFNKLKIKHYDRIESNMNEGKIYEGSRLRGRIYYHNPSHKRYIKDVDYLDEKENVCVTDHYDLHGRQYGKTSFFSPIGRVMRAYYNEEGQEVITENFITKDIIFNDLINNQVRLFKNIVEFTIFFLKKMGLDKQPIYYNSLSYPFFVSQRMDDRDKEDILFWQEDIYNEIPGNMKVILNNQSSCTKRIFVQRKEAYQKLIELNAPKDIVKELGLIYEFKKSSKEDEILILTNSDQIEHLEEIVRSTNKIIHIAAITEMSSKLLKFNLYHNVRIYPNVTEKQAYSLLERCSIYLDINYGSEILNAIRSAFIHELVIFGFKETIHHHEYIAKDHIFNKEDVSLLIEAIHKDYQEELQVQKQYGLVENIESYKNKL